MYSSVLFGITLVLYCAATILYLWSVVSKSGGRVRGATAAAFLGLVAHTAAIVARGVEQHRPPFTNLFESLAFVAWALVAIYLLMERRYRITAMGVFVGLLAFTTIVCGSVLPKDVSSSLLPALKSGWSTVHVVTSLIGWASFALAFGAAMGYMLQEHLLKAKRATTVQRHLPSLDVMDHIAYKMVALGFAMLTLGVITGSLWAQTAWGRYWQWDSKETWALITWLVYAAYLHVRIVQRWRSRWSNRLLVAGFICVLMTYLGVNCFSYGLHRYNW